MLSIVVQSLVDWVSTAGRKDRELLDRARAGHDHDPARVAISSGSRDKSGLRSWCFFREHRLFSGKIFFGKGRDKRVGFMWSSY